MVLSKEKKIDCKGTPYHTGPTNEEDLAKVRWLYFMPIWVTIIVLCIIFTIYLIISARRRNRKVVETEPEIELVENETNFSKPKQISEDTKSKKRLVCLDTFRGMSLLFMIFVNYGGAEYWFLQHAPWHRVVTIITAVVLV